MIQLNFKAYVSNDQAVTNYKNNSYPWLCQGEKGKREKKSWTIWEVKIVIEILLSPLKLAIFNVHGHIIDNKNGLTRQQKTDPISNRIPSRYAKQPPIGLASFREVT